MTVNLWVWIATFIVIGGFFVFDFYSHVRVPHAPSIKESALWSLFYVALAIIFGVFLWIAWPAPGNPHQHGIEFFAGYVTEKSLSVDNLFVFALIFTAFQIPRKYQQKVLLIGIVLALVFRGAFIALGAAAIKAWSEVFYLFGLFLVYTAIKLVIDKIRDAEPQPVHEMRIVRIVNGVIPVTRKLHGDRLTFRVAGKWLITPLAVALITIAVTDLLFALDSIPAIFGLTSEPYIVFTTNAFALLGLRQMYFLLDGLLDRLVLLSYGLAIILGFIGIKLILEALEHNSLSFINGGNPVPVWVPSTVGSLLFIIVVLALTTVLSIIKSKHDEETSSPVAE